MSNVMRPQGPLPSRVYWTRRLLLLGLLLVVVLLAWWLFSGGSGTAANQRVQTAPTSGRQSLPSPPPTSPPPTSPPSASQPAQAPHRSTQSSPAHRSTQSSPAHRSTRSGRPTKRRTHVVLAKPTGDCNSSQVKLAIKAKDSATGRRNTVDFVLTSTSTPACRLAITPNSFEVRVTSGNVVVWSSRDCPNALAAKEVVVRAHPASSYRFTWNGHLSNSACRGLGRVAAPGGYWVEAALIGGNPQRAYFDVTGAKP